MSKTIIITSRQHLDQVLESSQVVVADFYADWCGPCKQIAPIFEQLSAQLSRPNQITFVKINTDEQQDVAHEYGVSALPTFMVFKNGVEEEKIRGADPQKLQRVVRDLVSIANGPAAGSSSAAEGDNGGSNTWRTAQLPKGYTDVTDQIDVKSLELLNADDSFGTVRELFDNNKPSALQGKGKAEESRKDWVESDTDEQLMLFAQFQAQLKIHTIQLTSLPPSESDDTIPMRPKTIHLYINRPHILGFEEAEDIQATQTITLGASDWDSAGTANIALRFVKFQNVTSIVVFVVDGDGDGDKVRVDRIRFVGETGEKRDQGQLKKITDDE